MSYTQDDKLISIDTPLGKDVLLLTGLAGAEAISRLFSFQLSMVSESHSLSFEAIIGKRVTVTIRRADGHQRYFNGIIASFSQGRGGGDDGGDGRFTYYRATMVSWFWVLTRAANSRIFQNLSTVEIVEKVLKEQGFTDYRLELQGGYEKREYCVQYRETDHDFVSRLLEEEGVFYFFEHDEAKHTMVLSDNPAAHKPCPGQKSASCQLSAQAVRKEDVITALEVTQQVGLSGYSVSDFNFKIPNTSLHVEVQGQDKIGLGSRTSYEYPARHQSRTAGDTMAKIRMEEDEAQTTVISGASDCSSFASGFRFRLKEHPRADLNDKEYLLLSVTHEATEGYGAETGAVYRNSFQSIPHSIPYRPPRVTRKPVVQGTQTAVVVGPSGEEIYTDQHGRVKVQFHWDHQGKKNDLSSCWIRVSQLWAGNGWGGLHTPRVGQEVIVDFLEGDPDRPIIMGQLYNGLNLPPYPLPDHRTKTCIKSNSSPGGGGCNEIRFEDRKGSEQLFIHASRQQDSRVEADSLEWVGQDRHLIVARDRLEKVCGDQHLTVAGNRNEKVDGTMSLTVSDDLQQKVGSKYALDAGEEIHLKAGARIILEAGTRISLKVGGNFIDIGPAGVTIVGTMVLIDSGGTAGFGSGSSPELPKTPNEADRAAEPGQQAQQKPTGAGAQTAALKTASTEGKFYCGK